jgi:hypothetical protein
MIAGDFLGRKTPDISILEGKNDIKGLVRLLSHASFNVSWRAAEALGRIGAPAVAMLHARVRSGAVHTRLGIVEALAEIRDPSSLPVLLELLSEEPSNEVRWAAAVAVGDFGDPAAVPHLVAALKDTDKYVRYGAAGALALLDWEPGTAEDRARMHLALQDWEELARMREIPVPALVPFVNDKDAAIRAKVVEIIGMAGDPAARSICDTVLKDPDPRVRWTATLAFPHCNIPIMHLPRGLSRRKRSRKNPYIASFLNFLFLGLGYNYLGKWWGFLLFQINITSILILSIAYGPVIPYILSYSVSALSVIHTWHVAGTIPDI